MSFRTSQIDRLAELRALCRDPFQPADAESAEECETIRGRIITQSDLVAAAVKEKGTIADTALETGGTLTEHALSAAREFNLDVQEVLTGKRVLNRLTELRLNLASKLIPSMTRSRQEHFEFDRVEALVAILLNRRMIARVVNIAGPDEPRKGIDGSHILLDDFVGERILLDAGIHPNVMSRVPSYRGWFTQQWGHPKSDMGKNELFDIFVTLMAKESEMDRGKLRRPEEGMESFEKKFLDVAERTKKGEGIWKVQRWGQDHAWPKGVDTGLYARAANVYGYLLSEWLEKHDINWEQVRQLEQ